MGETSLENDYYYFLDEEKVIIVFEMNSHDHAVNVIERMTMVNNNRAFTLTPYYVHRNPIYEECDGMGLEIKPENLLEVRALIIASLYEKARVYLLLGQLKIPVFPNTEGKALSKLGRVYLSTLLEITDYIPNTTDDE